MLVALKSLFPAKISLLNSRLNMPHGGMAPSRNLKFERCKTIMFTPLILLSFLFSFYWWMTAPSTQQHKLDTWESSCDSSLLSVTKLCWIFFINMFLLLPWFFYFCCHSFNTDSCIHFPWFSCLHAFLCFIAVICLFGFTVLLPYFCWQVHVFVHWQVWLFIWPSLICFDIAHVSFFLPSALYVPGNAKLFKSSVPYGSCHFWWTLVYLKSPVRMTPSLWILSCLHSEQRFPFLGSQEPCLHLCWHLCHVVIVCVCVCLFSLLFWIRILFFLSLYS